MTGEDQEKSSEPSTRRDDLDPRSAEWFKLYQTVRLMHLNMAGMLDAREPDLAEEPAPRMAVAVFAVVALASVVMAVVSIAVLADYLFGAIYAALGLSVMSVAYLRWTSTSVRLRVSSAVLDAEGLRETGVLLDGIDDAVVWLDDRVLIDKHIELKYRVRRAVGEAEAVEPLRRRVRETEDG